MTGVPFSQASPPLGSELLCFSLWQSLVADSSFKMQGRIERTEKVACLAMSLHFIFQMNELIKNALDFSQKCM